MDRWMNEWMNQSVNESDFTDGKTMKYKSVL